MPGGLLLVFLYWQVVPLLMAATGASLDLRKLQAYPIPVSQLFSIEVMLRVTAAIEMLLVLLGIAAGILLNPRLPKWCALAVAALHGVQSVPGGGPARSGGARFWRASGFANSRFSAGAGCGAAAVSADARRPGRRPARASRAAIPGKGWPWTAAANLAQGSDVAISLAVLAGLER